jgi:hypothetical protein
VSISVFSWSNCVCILPQYVWCVLLPCCTSYVYYQLVASWCSSHDNVLSRARVVVSRKSTLQNLVEASRSFITFPSLPFPSSRLSPPTGWVSGERPGPCPRARFPVTSGTGVASLVCLRSLRIHRLLKWPARERSPEASCTAANPGGVRYGRVLNSGLICILNYVSIFLMFIPGVRPAGTLCSASFSGRDLDSLLTRTGASVFVSACIGNESYSWCEGLL